MFRNMFHRQYITAGMVAPPPLVDQLRLYHVNMNPYGHRVLLLLEAKRVKFEVYLIDPENLPEWFKQKNPRLNIPVLEVPTEQGDKFIFGSIVICDYLDDECARNRLHSWDPYLKAQDRILIESFNELIQGAMECFYTKLLYGGDKIIQTLDIFNKELVTRGTIYYGGNKPGMVDYMIWPWIERLYLLRHVNVKRFDEICSLLPNIVNWGYRMQLDDVVMKHFKRPAEYLDYYKSHTLWATIGTTLT